MMESAREKTMSFKRHLKWSARFGGYPEEVLLRIAEFCTEMRYETRDELVVKPQYVYLVCRGSKEILFEDRKYSKQSIIE
uniref:Cyclic nucleotide-binding domain-containing protein n=1 Tax=Caenorhabditis tropicalis TaxID=1561998 RepID=A0A1I7UYH7_9PELO